MANELKMAMVQSILSLHQKGWSHRRSAWELGIDRGAVARRVRLAAEAAQAERCSARAGGGTGRVNDPPMRRPTRPPNRLIRRPPQRQKVNRLPANPAPSVQNAPRAVPTRLRLDSRNGSKEDNTMTPWLVLK